MGTEPDFEYDFGLGEMPTVKPGHFMVPVTQFMMPNGRSRPEFVELPIELEPKFQEVVKAGCRITAEVLMTGQVSVCIEEPKLGDFIVKVGPNGPGERSPANNIKTMLAQFTTEDFNTWKRGFFGDAVDVDVEVLTEEPQSEGEAE